MVVQEIFMNSFIIHGTNHLLVDTNPLGVVDVSNGESDE
jgi:hypothetical protein